MKGPVCVLLVLSVAPATAAAQPSMLSPRMGYALEQVAEGDLVRAGLALHDVATGKSPDGRAVRERAQYELGKVLFKMGLMSVSAAMFDRVLNAPRHPYRHGALGWLVALARHPGAREAALGLLAQVPASDLPAALEWPTVAPLADEARYRRGLALRGRADEEAVQLFRAVDSDAYYLDARLAEAGVSWARGDTAAARAVLSDALALASDARAGRRFPAAARARVRGAAALALARIALLEERWDEAQRWAALVPAAAPERAAALLEASLADLARRGREGGRAELRALQTVELDERLAPAPDVLGALVYLGWCGPLAQQAPADDALASARRSVSKLAARIARLRRVSEDDSSEVARGIMALRAALATGRSIDEADRLLVALTDGPELAEGYARMAAYQVEGGRLRVLPRVWQHSELGSDALQELELMKSLAEAELGQLIERRLSKVRLLLDDFRGFAVARVDVGSAGGGGGAAGPSARAGLWLTRSGCARFHPPAPPKLPPASRGEPARELVAPQPVG
ncbi:MAG: hypothetical protein IT370_23675 [Deltaproteobacteria bacterium]|nr:hypothetical protein [Deltaproteobacteria bacterium]